MRRSRGYSIITDPRFSRPTEVDTFTCLHCQQVVDKPPYKSATDVGAWCHCCNGPICGTEWCLRRGCIPVERWLERQESRRYIRECL